MPGDVVQTGRRRTHSASGAWFLRSAMLGLGMLGCSGTPVAEPTPAVPSRPQPSKTPAAGPSVSPEAAAVPSPSPQPPVIFTTAVAALGTEQLEQIGPVEAPDGSRSWSAECLLEAKDPEVPSMVQTCTVGDVDVWTAHFGPASARTPVVTLQVLHLADPFVAGTAAHDVELHVSRLLATRLAQGERLVKEPATTWNHGADIVLVRARSHGPYLELEDTLDALRALAPDPSTF